MNHQSSSQSPTDSDQKYSTEEMEAPRNTGRKTPEAFIDLTTESEADDFQVNFLFFYYILRNIS